MKRFTVDVTWAEITQRTSTLTINANREDDAIALALAHVRNAEPGRRSINATVTRREAVPEPPAVADPHIVALPPVSQFGPGRRDSLAEHRGNGDG